MPRKEGRIVDQRLQFFSSYQKKEMSLSDLCLEFGVSRPDALSLNQLAQEGGPEGLLDLSRRPHGCSHASSEDVTQTRTNFFPTSIPAHLSTTASIICSSMRTGSQRRRGILFYGLRKRHQSGVRESPAGQIIIRGRTTNKSATLVPVRHRSLPEPAPFVKAHLLILRCGRRAAVPDYHARKPPFAQKR